MAVITIPDYFKTRERPDVGIHSYSSSDESKKQRIKLTQNVFSFLIEGRKEIITDTSTISITEANFVLIKKGHCLMTDRLSDNDTFKSTLLFFSDEHLHDLVRRFKIKPSENVQASSQLVFSFQYDGFIRDYVKSLNVISQLPFDRQRRLINTKIDEIILYLLETQGGDFINSLLFTGNHQAQAFIDVVENNKYNKMSVKELAFLLNMSISSFKREFTKHYSESPIKWLQNNRLEYAAFLLKQKQKRPSEIFSEVGYESLSSFIQAFKTKYGITPKQYQ